MLQQTIKNLYPKHRLAEAVPPGKLSRFSFDDDDDDDDDDGRGGDGDRRLMD